MTPRLVIHLGDMKTGSTAIQSTLSKRAWECSSTRLIFPCGVSASHSSLAQSLQGQGNPDRIAALFNEIRLEMASELFDVAVISAEQFENVDPLALKAALERHLPEFNGSVQLIAYVRPHAERLASIYAERVKIGVFRGTLAELATIFEQRRSLYYRPRFAKWQAAWGEAFTLRPMIRDRLHKRDVVADFLKFALKTEDFSLRPTPDSNESVTLENLSVLRLMHLKLMQGATKAEEHQAILGRALARRMNEVGLRQGTKVQLHRALAERLCNVYARDALALDRAYFDGTPMSDALAAAPDKAVEVEQSIRVEDHFSERERALILPLLDQACALALADPKLLAERLRLEYRAKVLAEERQARAEKVRLARAAARAEKTASAQKAAQDMPGKADRPGTAERQRKPGRAVAVPDAAQP